MSPDDPWETVLPMNVFCVEPIVPTAPGAEDTPGFARPATLVAETGAEYVPKIGRAHV